jgi:hypothetical protein
MFCSGMGYKGLAMREEDGYRARPSFIARWWLLVPMSAGAALWWAAQFGHARRLWLALFG